MMPATMQLTILYVAVHYQPSFGAASVAFDTPQFITVAVRPAISPSAETRALPAAVKLPSSGAAHAGTCRHISGTVGAPRIRYPSAPLK